MAVTALNRLSVSLKRIVGGHVGPIGRRAAGCQSLPGRAPMGP